MDEVKILPLASKDAISFLKQRREMEKNTPHMPSSEGEHKGNIILGLLRMFLHRKRIVTFIAKADGKIVGYITLIFGRFRKFRGNAYIANVSVRPEYRGKGIGKKLMARAEEYAKSRRARRLELEVFAQNVGAINLYEELGYEKEGSKRKAIEGKEGFDDLIFMAKFL